MAKRKKGSSVEDFVIDFSKEEQGGRGKRYKKGTYRARVIKAKPTTSDEKNTPGLLVTFKFKGGKLDGKTLDDTLWASPKAYSRFRTLLEACGKKVPQKVNLVRIAKAIKGEELYIEIDDEKREGYSTRSRVTFDGFISLDDYEADDDEDEEEDLDDEPDEDDEDDEDEDEDDEDDDSDEDDDEEDDEEDEEPPKKRRRAKKSSSKKRERKKADDEDEDEDDLEDLDLDDF